MKQDKFQEKYLITGKSDADLANFEKTLDQNSVRRYADKHPEQNLVDRLNTDLIEKRRIELEPWYNASVHESAKDKNFILLQVKGNKYIHKRLTDEYIYWNRGISPEENLIYNLNKYINDYYYKDGRKINHRHVTFNRKKLINKLGRIVEQLYQQLKNGEQLTQENLDFTIQTFQQYAKQYNKQGHFDGQYSYLAMLFDRYEYEVPIYQKKLEQKNKKLAAKLSEKKQKLKKEKQDHEKEKQNHINDNSEYEIKIKSKSDEVIQLKKVNDELETFKADKAVHEQLMLHLETKNKKLESEKSNLQAEKIDLEIKKTQLENDLKAVQEKLQVNDNKILELDKENEELKATNQSLNDDKTELLEELEKLNIKHNEEVVNQKKVMNDLRYSQEELLKKKDGAEKKLDEFKAKSVEMSGTVKEQKKLNKQLEEKNKNLEKEISKLNKKGTDDQTRIYELESILDLFKRFLIVLFPGMKFEKKHSAKNTQNVVEKFWKEPASDPVDRPLFIEADLSETASDPVDRPLFIEADLSETATVANNAMQLTKKPNVADILDGVFLKRNSSDLKLDEIKKEGKKTRFSDDIRRALPTMSFLKKNSTTTDDVEVDATAIAINTESENVEPLGQSDKSELPSRLIKSFTSLFSKQSESDNAKDDDNHINEEINSENELSNT